METVAEGRMRVRITAGYPGDGFGGRLGVGQIFDLPLPVARARSAGGTAVAMDHPEKPSVRKGGF